VGSELEMTEPLSTTSQLFSESPSRIIISFDAAQREAIEAIAARYEVPFSVLGQTSGASLIIKNNGEVAIDRTVAELEAAWRDSLPRKLEAEAMAAGME
jgi:phosphoribosylformylglycinamidine (FGAM) synthase-like enzyme